MAIGGIVDPNSIFFKFFELFYGNIFIISNMKELGYFWVQK